MCPSLIERLLQMARRLVDHSVQHGTWRAQVMRITAA